MRGRSSLALGNVVGSAISNILGAFSLGLLFYSGGERIQFDRSSRIYSVFLLVLTTFVAPVVYFPRYEVWLVCGAVLVVVFVAYVLGVGVAISRGVLTAPEDSDSESDSDSDDGSSDTLGDAGAAARSDSHRDRRVFADSSTPSETSALLAGRSRSGRRPLRYHLFQLILGFLGICLAGYILSQAATNITDQMGISDVFCGVIILAIATTLPEKFIAVMSGQRRHPGILVANCVGSNVFLLVLCLGVIMLDTKGTLDHAGVTIAELSVLWVSVVSATLTVWFGGRFPRWIGTLMVVGYIAFITVEFTSSGSVAD